MDEHIDTSTDVTLLGCIRIASRMDFRGRLWIVHTARFAGGRGCHK